jgi:hypothetical protein
MHDVFISTEPSLLNYKQCGLLHYASEAIVQKWQTYWHNKPNHTFKYFEYFYHLPYQNIEYIQPLNYIPENQHQKYIALLFISPHSIHSYYAAFGNALPKCQEIWLIGYASYECLLHYYAQQLSTIKIIYVDESHNMHAQGLYEKLKQHSCLFLKKQIEVDLNLVNTKNNVLVIKGQNSGNNYLYDTLTTQHKINIDYLYTYQSIPTLYTKTTKIAQYCNEMNTIPKNIVPENIALYVSSSKALDMCAYFKQNYFLNIPTSLYTKHQKILISAQTMTLFNSCILM